jgi:2,4-dienoyl-CoA reductase-like NADH-dependent reductase (Old Yellow Enzyme family)
MNGAAALDVRRHQLLRFRTADALPEAARSLGVDLPFRDDLGPLLSPATVAGQVVPNRMAVQPLEACDAHADGSPSETTVERYRRDAAGGSGLIRVEATSIVPEGRANPHQLMLTPATRGAFARLVAVTRQAARDALGDAHRPLLALQITRAGRGGFLAPGATRRVACANPYRDVAGVAVSVRRDEELDAMVETFVRAAGLAREAGFDAVDVKACHGYLVSALMRAHVPAGCVVREPERYKAKRR